jgi:hypothetical protein
VRDKGTRVKDDFDDPDNSMRLQGASCALTSGTTPLATSVASSASLTSEVLGTSIGSSGSISALLGTNTPLFATSAADVFGTGIGTSGSFSALVGTSSPLFATSAAAVFGTGIGTSGSFSALLGTDRPLFANSTADVYEAGIGTSASISALLGSSSSSIGTSAASMVGPSHHSSGYDEGIQFRLGTNHNVAYALPIFSLPGFGNKRRRFELLWPLQFNDGRAVPPELLEEARAEILDQFDGVSCETAKIDGYWRNKNGVVRDALMRLWVDVPDLESNRSWMKRYKERWKRRLDQDELWLVDYEVEVD